MAPSCPLQGATTLHTLPVEVLHLILALRPGNQAAQLATLCTLLRVAFRTAPWLNAHIGLHDTVETAIDSALLGVSKLFGDDGAPQLASLTSC